MENQKKSYREKLSSALDKLAILEHRLNKAITQIDSLNRRFSTQEITIKEISKQIEASFNVKVHPEYNYCLTEEEFIELFCKITGLEISFISNKTRKEPFIWYKHLYRKMFKDYFKFSLKTTALKTCAGDDTRIMNNK